MSDIFTHFLDFFASTKKGEFISLGYYEKDDVAVVVEYLSKSKIVSSIALWGRSMGAATSLIYTSEHPGDIACLVLDSPFSSLYQLASEVVHGMDVGFSSFVSFFPLPSFLSPFPFPSLFLFLSISFSFFLSFPPFPLPPLLFC